MLHTHITFLYQSTGWPAIFKNRLTSIVWEYKFPNSLSGIWIPEMQYTQGDSSCWFYWFCALLRLEAELDIDDFCEENLYPTVVAWLIAVCNKNFLVFDGGMIKVVG